MKYAITCVASMAALLSAVQAAEPVESDFYTETNHLVDDTVNIVTDYGANGTDTLDDSGALLSAISDMTALANGGKIIIPAGTFYLDSINMKSNVHIEIDSGATIKSASTVTNNTAIFYYGAKNGVDEVTPVNNSSLRGSGGRFLVDLTSASNPNIVVIFCTAAQNFYIADIDVLDNQTKFSSITVNTGEHNGVYSMCSNGIIKNITCTNQRYGYGVMQMKSGTNILFKNLDGEGGATLRLESGGQAYAHPPEYIMDDIYARDIYCTDGRCAVMVSPHTRDNGYVDIDRVTSIGCGFAATISPGFRANGEIGTPGTFDPASVISNVHAIYGDNAQLKTKHFGWVPCAIRGNIGTVKNPDGESYPGPAAANILYDADPNDGFTEDGEYAFNIFGLTQAGFNHQFKLLVNNDDEINNCNLVPVTGLSITPSSLSVELGATAGITPTISPSNATDSSVSWASAAPSIASVDSAGIVTGQSAGIVTITATATDGGYTDTTTVTVTSGNGAPSFTTDPFSKGNATVGVAYSKSIKWQASDPEGDSMSFEKVSGPAWLTIAAGGNISGTPTAGDVGLNSFVVEVSANGGIDTATLNITVVAPGWSELTSDDFESGFGNWTGGGSDARLSSSFAVGSQCFAIQDDSSTSVVTLTNALDLSSSAQLKVDFSYVVQSFESAEDFSVEFSSDGGATWTSIQTYVNDVDFVDDGTRYNESVTIDSSSYSFTNNVKVRFRCNASSNGDDVYIDDVVISAQ